MRFAEAGLIKLEPQVAELGTGQVARALGHDQQRRDLVYVLGNEAAERGQIILRSCRGAVAPLDAAQCVGVL